MKKFDFGTKVTFKNQDKIHPDLINKDFCLLGFNESAFALVEWDKKGSYDFEFYTGSLERDLEVIE